MKFAVIFAFIALASAAPQQRGFGRAQATAQVRRPAAPPRAVVPASAGRTLVASTGSGDAQIISRNFNNDGNAYQFDFETSDGIRRSESGQEQSFGVDSGIVMRGEYSYVGDDGNTYRVS